MKKIIMISVLLMWKLGACIAQFTMTLQVPPSGMLMKPQLWNVVVVNSYAETRQIFLGLTFSDAVSGEPIFTATTAKVSVQTGAVQLQYTQLSPINYEYLSSILPDQNPDGFLPAGNYTACYTLFTVDENSGSPEVEQCIPVAIEPVSPPMLNTPFNEEIVQTHLPQFTWIPPAPLEIYSALNYDFLLVEVQEGQEVADAIQQNLPVYTTNTNDPFVDYPSSGIQLDTGKKYAWKVIAKNNQQYSAESESWSFIISDTTPGLKNNPVTSYTKLKRIVDGSISIAVDNLQAYYENYPDDSIAEYNVYDIDESSSGNGSMQPVKTGQLILTAGQNLLNIDLNSSGITTGKEYLFQLTNSRNEIWSVKFVYFRKD